MDNGSKYYTPEIEDFHVGFEFEFETGTEGWKKFVFEKDRANNVLNNVNEFNSQFRVKYLDREDVESLGWFYTGRAVDLWFNKVGMFDSASGTHRFTELKLHFGPEDHVLYINAYFGNQDEGCLFEGIIRNKSELRKLMKQLKIEEVPNAVS